MIIRKHYLEQLQLFRKKQLIKVITGIRRCGKSTLLLEYAANLKKEGISDEQIIYINFEDLKNEFLLDYKKMYEYITNKLVPDGYTYVMLDEVQRVPNFQKAVDSLYLKNNVDMYITGSNSDLLSSELATLLTGRYVEIKMLPLSFSEYIEAFPNEKPREVFARYLEFGAMPYTIDLPNKEAVNIYLDGIYHTILNNDILRRHPQADMGVLESILHYLMHNIGSLTSSTKIADTLTSNHRKTSYNTVERYIGYLREAFLIYEAKRYDLKGRQHLKSLAKYYVVDNGLRNILLANSSTDIGHVLENIVYFELLYRGYKVSVGKVDTSEVNFIARNGDDIRYFQVSTTIMDEEKRRRELEPLEKIKDFYPRTLITLDDFGLGNYNGIKIINAIDFLLPKS